MNNQQKLTFQNSKQKDQHQHLLSALADYLCENRDDLTNEWMEAVHRSPQIQSSEKLDSRQLANHMPNLFDDLAIVLRRADAVQIEQEIAHDAYAHGADRWEQGYDLAELLHEVATIRSVIFFSGISGFARQNPAFSDAAKKHAKEIVHRFFSEVNIQSAQRFVH